MKLSIVVICWNDVPVIGDCLRSIYAETSSVEFEIVVADNGSTDGSAAYVRENFPAVQLVENGGNLGFGAGNNAGFKIAHGEYVLILNPDTIVRDRALEKLVAYADRHPEAGAFGCRVLNLDGSFQRTAQPQPTVGRYLTAALDARWLGENFSDQYEGWAGRTEKEIGFQAGCCLLVRNELLHQLGGFDERFFHQFEDVDLCHRIWTAGNSVLFCPTAEITHIGGQNRGGYPVGVVLETERSKYRYFHKHYGNAGAVRIRYVSLLACGLRVAGYGLLHYLRPSAALANRLATYRVLLAWHWRLNPTRFIETGAEPDLGYQSLSPARRAGKNQPAGKYVPV